MPRRRITRQGGYKVPEGWEPTDDPIQTFGALWPQYKLWYKQAEIIRSVWENRETFVYAGNELGKDFTAGAIIVMTFLMFDECRIVATSVSDRQLAVLWGETQRFIYDSAVPLTVDEGGFWVVNHHHVYKYRKGKVDTISYIKFMVAGKGETLEGHHANDMTLAVIDEACHDSETDVLTNEGWKRFSSLTGNELFLTMNPDNRRAEYRPATKIYSSKRSGPMHLYEQRCGNFCVTPNHKMLWKHKQGWKPQGYSPYYQQMISQMSVKAHILT